MKPSRWKKRFVCQNDWRFTAPKHGSWLAVAEIELSAHAAQCPGYRRIPGVEALNKEPLAWETKRNIGQKSVDWHFTTG
jgi:hypothetical protein